MIDIPSLDVASIKREKGFVCPVLRLDGVCVLPAATSGTARINILLDLTMLKTMFSNSSLVSSRWVWNCIALISPSDSHLSPPNSSSVVFGCRSI